MSGFEIWTTLSPLQFSQTPEQLLFYIDVNGKEWIILLTPKYTVFSSYNPGSHYKSYLYDVENDEIAPFKHDYDVKRLMKKYRPVHVDINNDVSTHLYTYISHVIDNDNHVMYWLVCICVGRNSYAVHAPRSSIMIAFDIKDLNNIKLIYETAISQEEFPKFSYQHYSMFIVGNTIQMVLGGNTGNVLATPGAWRHYEFNIKTRKLKLIHKNIHLEKYGDSSNYNVRHSKMLNLFNNLEIGDWIDARDKDNKFYLAQILDIKDKKYVTHDQLQGNHDHGSNLKSMKIKIHYKGWEDKYDEWIYITTDYINIPCVSLDELQLEGHESHDTSINTGVEKICKKKLNSLCDCNDKCYFTKKEININNKNSNDRHRIALANSQSMRSVTLNNLNAVYSKYHKKLIILGSNKLYNSGNINRGFGGVYYNSINRDNINNCEKVLNGFIHMHENKTNINIPKDIISIIFKYYFIANDNQWTQLTKQDKNGKFIKDMFSNCFYYDCACVLANHGDDIFMFGGRGDKARLYKRDIFKLNITTNCLHRLTFIQCPQFNCIPYVVFCTKSKNVHLFNAQFSKHVSISLKRLNNAASVVVDD